MTDAETIAVLTARVAELREALDRILHELGVPGDGYPSPVANAYDIATEALSISDDELLAEVKGWKRAWEAWEAVKKYVGSFRLKGSGEDIHLRGQNPIEAVEAAVKEIEK